jgi:hypothetical protein
MSIRDLPAINASLNAVSTVFIAMGWFGLGGTCGNGMCRA